MKLILDLDQRPDGRLGGSIALAGDPALRSFSGVMELVARVEELRETATTTNNRRSTMSQLFFTDPAFEFETRNVLGNVHYGCGDVGEVLAAVAAITDGDDSSWVAQWQALARRVEAIAAGTQTRGHKVSARNAYLRAAAYYATALSAIDGAEDGEALLGPVFTAHRRCFDAHVSLLDPAAEAVAIPYEGGTLPGYLFVPAADGQARPTLILINGSDGPVTAVWPGLGAPALARGYNALVLDGPGQQSMLFERQVPFRPDWEHVITPVVDFLEGRPEVDAGRLALYGLSQGGYWVPRALAFEHRIAVAVADPGVDDVAASWLANLTPEMLALLDTGEQEKFDAFMATFMQSATHASARSCNGAPSHTEPAIPSTPSSRRWSNTGSATSSSGSARRSCSPTPKENSSGPASHGASTTLCPAPRCSCRSPRPRARTCTVSRWPAASSNSACSTG